MPNRNNLLVEHMPKLRRYARALAGDINRADDLVQDCLARALSRMHLWEPGTDMRAWLFTIMHNLFVNDCRKQSRQPEVVTTEALAELRAWLDGFWDQALAGFAAEVSKRKGPS